MDIRASNGGLGLAQNTTTCPYEEKVVTDPTTARIVLTFLREFVEQKIIYSHSSQGYYCPMTKCESSFTEPLLLIQHLFTCPELGRGEFECWKCCSWHRFPTTEKEWTEWAGWKSTAVGFQRKRSLGSKMKETLTDTLTLRRRNSNRRFSVSSAGPVGNAGLDQTPNPTSTSSMISSPTLTGTTADMDGIASTIHHSGKFLASTDACEWNQFLGLDQAQMLSPRSIQELQTAYRVDQQMVPTFSHPPGANLGLDSTPGTANASGYTCTFDEGCFVTSEHHHHHHGIGVKPGSGAGISTMAAACSCDSFGNAGARHKQHFLYPAIDNV
ncbi:hypothetical protein SPBR_08894 [Sporothrix brasiliensis 5110]|uniref:Uncharacterized protein n=1 Tax=Sporothrix brasiliensis 5110 TaxID=1398154 RepID=A0A0C2INE3_9PEZI|nr:uncharacterized protein SPBR_08894 [Sporothrix brasiliensis 5110]KIH86552.1 hypothetical protein SPBR_08894 [Sporothrix brasiliensis 5110]